MKVLMSLLFVLCLCCPVSAWAEDSFDDLLRRIRLETDGELAVNRAREQAFLSAEKDAAALLKQAKAELASLKRTGEKLQDTIDENEVAITALEEKLQRKMGDMGELFGVTRQVAGELKAEYVHDITTVHFPERGAFLQNLAERKGLPDMSALEKLWLILLEGLNASGEVVRFDAPVVQTDGTSRDQEVVRIGTYGAVSEGRFLAYDPEGMYFTNALKQPPTRFRMTAKNFDTSAPGMVKIMIDPTRGQLLSMLTRKPSLRDRIRQGGVIGYIIIGIGIVGLLIGFLRYVWLMLISARINKQARHLDSLKTDNPLGRIASIYKAAMDRPQAEKEVLLDEAILKEAPRVERFNTFIKLLAAVSPLLGLLGTVTGMILTFQSITLFGTGDPRLMAGGISTALVTTVLGLCAAIPLLFVYTFIAAKSKSILDTIEHQSVGLIAREVAKSA
ncbi:MAG: hypothetical protein CSA22_03555 [Deltaproteobacteria bacterium]|nr:MAG: hypothetical protein CSA22_03555 [Deltaproteobacteria bacterium]